MVNGNLCPVCGYEMQDPPRDYNICPSCGTEFGHHDVNASIPDLRSAWLRTGPKWWSTATPERENWNPFEQLAHLFDAQTSGTAAVRPEILPVCMPEVPAAVVYMRELICLDPEITFRFPLSGNPVFAEVESFRDLVSPARVELKELIAAQSRRPQPPQLCAG